MIELIKEVSYVKLGKNSKIPIASHINWQNERCSYEKIKNYKKNLGIATGNISHGIYVLDWDFRSGKKREGFKLIYEEYEKTFPKLSKTLTVESPHGFHFYYILKDVSYRNTSQKNGGYSNTLKSFIGSNSVRFGKFLKGFDSRGEGGYVVCPPSVVNGKKYETYNDIDPVEITDHEYEQIFGFFKEKDEQSHTMRKAFVDIAYGKISPQDYKKETKLKEHVYWKEFYHEACSCLGVLPEDLLDGLEKYNRGFNREKTIIQLNNDKNRNYILNGKRLSKEKYREYFPDYLQINSSIKKTKESLEELLNLANEKSTDDELGNILSLVDEKDRKKLSDVINTLQEKTKMGKNDLKWMYKHYRDIRKQKIIDIFSDENKKEKKGLICSYDFKNGVIENQEEGVYFVVVNEDNQRNEEHILESPFELIHKTEDSNIDLFSYKFRNRVFNTQSRADMISKFEQFRYFGDRGKDVLKRLISCMGDELEYTELKSIWGWDDGWVLPQLQKENNYRILISTDFQNELYEYCKDLINNNYNIKKIKKKIDFFLKKTSMKMGKACIIIGWVISSIFRLSFIRYFGLAPDLLLLGDPQTGKTSFSKAIIINIINVWKRIFQGSEVATLARFEDVMSTSSFPILIDEVDIVHEDIIATMKARSTEIVKYTRKTSQKEMFSHYESAGYIMTANDVPKAFVNAGLIDRFIVINFFLSDTIEEKQEWNNISKELKKMHIFSAIYNYTKEWNDDKIFEIIEKIEKRCRSFKRSERDRKKYIFVLFGLVLLYEVFGIDLYENLDEKLFIKSQMIITEDLLNNFINFCRDAIAFIYDDDGNRASSNRKYVQHPLIANKGGKGDYVFTPMNLRDFNEFNKYSDYNLHKLSLQLNKAISEEKYFEYGRHSLNGEISISIKFPKDFNKKYKELQIVHNSKIQKE